MITTILEFKKCVDRWHFIWNSESEDKCPGNPDFDYEVETLARILHHGEKDIAAKYHPHYSKLLQGQWSEDCDYPPINTGDVMYFNALMLSSH